MEDFQNQGKVVDVFIPRKSSLNGRKFVFVRFMDRIDARRAVNMLNGAWLFDFRLAVSFAKFNCRSTFWRKINPGGASPSTMVEENLMTSYNKGNGDLAQCSKCTEIVLDDLDVTHKEEADVSSEDSLDLALANMKSCLRVVEEEEAIHKLENCSVGVARDYCETGSLMENFRMSEVFDISIKKISGRQFLIEFEDIEVRNKMEEQNWLWLKEWFVEIETWSVYSYAKFRTT
ncbi:hypothetical protein REPUB_Repub15cG0078800 [Reevesia pubescens]